MVTVPAAFVVLPLLAVFASLAWLARYLLRDTAAEILWRARDEVLDRAEAGLVDESLAALDDALVHFDAATAEITGAAAVAPSPWTFSAMWLAHRMPAPFAGSAPAKVADGVDAAIAKALMAGSLPGWCWAAALWVRAAVRREGRGAVSAAAVRAVAAHRGRVAVLRSAAEAAAAARAELRPNP